MGGTTARLRALGWGWAGKSSLSWRNSRGLKRPPIGSSGLKEAELVADRIAGALWGIFIGDALAMPAHWYYDVELLKEDYGTIEHYVEPKTKHATNFIMHRPGLVFPSSVVHLFTCLARFQEGTELSYEKDTTQVVPEVGPTSTFYRCITTGMHGPTSIFWANLTPVLLMGAPRNGQWKQNKHNVQDLVGVHIHFGSGPYCARNRGGTSPERCSHSVANLYISFVIIHTEYTGRRQNDFNGHG